MKKITFLIAAFAILMASCDGANKKTSKPDEPKQTKEEAVKTPILNEIQTTPEHYYTENFNYVKVYAFEEDGCKYIVATSTTHDFRGGTSIDLKHAASCTNPIHNK
jgi:hypothetical protein